VLANRAGLDKETAAKFFSKAAEPIPINSTSLVRVQDLLGVDVMGKIFDEASADRIKKAPVESRIPTACDIVRAVIERGTALLPSPIPLTPQDFLQLQRFSTRQLSVAAQALDAQAAVDDLNGRYGDSFARYFLAARLHSLAHDRNLALNSSIWAFRVARPIAVPDYLVLNSAAVERLLSEKNARFPRELIVSALTEYGAIDGESGFPYGIQQDIVAAAETLKSMPGRSEAITCLFAQRRVYHFKSLSRRLYPDATKQLENVTTGFGEWNLATGAASSDYSIALAHAIHEDFDALFKILDSKERERTFEQGTKFVVYARFSLKGYALTRLGRRDEARESLETAYNGMKDHCLVGPCSRDSLFFPMCRPDMLLTSVHRDVKLRGPIPEHDPLPIPKGDFLSAVSLLRSALLK